MSSSACVSDSSVRNTCALRSIVSCSALRMSATRSPSGRVRISSRPATTVAAGSSGSSTNDAVSAYAAAEMPARLPNTLMSSSELVPRRLEPCTLTQATSPAAYRPRMTSVSLRSTSASMLVGMPPIA